MKKIINGIFFHPLKKTLLTSFNDHKGNNNVYICGYPISGNSWISYLVTYILNCKYYDIDRKEWSGQRKELKKYLTGNNNHSNSRKVDWVLKTHSIPHNVPSTKDDKVIYLIRNIRDVVNSQFHRFDNSLPHSNRKFVRIAAKLLKFIIPFRIRYKYLTRSFADEWAKHVKMALKSKVFVLHYEDMYDNPYNELKKLILYLDPLAWDEKIVKDAIEIFSFNKMKQASINSLNNTNLVTDRIGGSRNWEKYFSLDDNQWFTDNYDLIMENVKSRKGISI